MAIKVKAEKKESKLVELLKKETRFENYFLLFISLIAMAMSVMILTGDLVPYEGFPLIGEYPKVFAVVLLIISVLGLMIVAAPFVQSIKPEFKKITWADWKSFVGDTVKVFIFIIVLALFFFFSEVVITEVVKLIG